MDANHRAVRTTSFNGMGSAETGASNRATLTLFPDASVSVSVLQVPKGDSMIFATKDHIAALATCVVGISRRTEGTSTEVEPGEYEIQSYGTPDDIAALGAIPGVTHNDDGTDFGTVTLTAEAIAAFGAPVDATGK